MSWEKEYEFKLALEKARKITKAIKYDDTVGEIMVQIEMLAEKTPGVNMRDLEWKMDELREAKNALESAVYGLEEPFEEAMRNASYEDDEDEEDVRESGATDLFGMLSKQFEKEFGAPMTDPMAKRSERPDRQRSEPHRGNDKKEVKESVAVKLAKAQTSRILEGIVSKTHEKCPHCGGELVSEELINEKKDACYYKVKSRYKVWPSAYASGALVQCRKKGASNWGKKSKK
jgi:hypothetical protein